MMRRRSIRFPARFAAVLLLGCLLGALPAPSGVSLPATREVDLRFETEDGVFLEGILELPEHVPEGTRLPLVVLVHSHGRDRTSLLPLADALATRGYAVALMDQRGHGASRSTRDHRIYAFPLLPARELRKAREDQVLLLRELARHPEVDTSRVAFVGVGYGALIAAAAAARLPEVRALVMVDVSDPVAGYRPDRDLGLFDRRPVLLVTSAFPESRARARRLAEYGSGERTVAPLEAYEERDRLLPAGSPGIAIILDWLARHLPVAGRATGPAGR